MVAFVTLLLIIALGVGVTYLMRWADQGIADAIAKADRQQRADEAADAARREWGARR